MSRKKLAWANKEVETFVCILGEEDVVYDVYVAATAIDIRPTTKASMIPDNQSEPMFHAKQMVAVILLVCYITLTKKNFYIPSGVHMNGRCRKYA
ncbi:unnamed protein product [Boreogadus saida]